MRAATRGETTLAFRDSRSRQESPLLPLGVKFPADQVHEEGDAVPGPPPVLIRRRASHVDVQPPPPYPSLRLFPRSVWICPVPAPVQVVGDELTRARCLRVRPVLHAVLHVRDLAPELFGEKLGRVRERVRQVSARPPRDDARAFHRLVVRHDPGEVLPRGDHLRAGQRRHVDDVVASQRPGRVRHAVGEHEPSLGVGVVNFHGSTREGRDHIVGTKRAGSHRVLGDAQHEVKLDAGTGAELAERLERAEGGGGSAHVRLHPRHSRLALDLQPAGVVRDPLAHERDLPHRPGPLLRRAVRPVLDVHQRGLPAVSRRRVAHRDQPAEPDRFQSVVPQRVKRDVQSIRRTRQLRRRRRRLTHERVGVHRRGRGVHDARRETHRPGDRDDARGRLLIQVARERRR
mmetsp:Transcript_13731/g.58128  ORF Transcript_13731/g.58128 Transcript_13731/m.58128 type:complete len:402 (+) Transcript_13731:211-1416(+)